MLVILRESTQTRSVLVGGSTCHLVDIILVIPPSFLRLPSTIVLTLPQGEGRARLVLGRGTSASVRCLLLFKFSVDLIITFMHVLTS